MPISAIQLTRCRVISSLRLLFWGKKQSGRTNKFIDQLKKDPRIAARGCSSYKGDNASVCPT